MSAKIDVTIIIVHTFEKNLVRQTLRGLRRAAPQVSHEVIVVDNNPKAGVKDVLRDFENVLHLPMERNLGFGAGMNRGIAHAKGRYILIFNPDIVIRPGSLEKMTEFMDQNPDVGICGPKLLNPDGSLQYSCYRQPHILLPAYRRTPIGMFKFARESVRHYLMINESHHQEMDVDSLIGAALFTRVEDLKEVGIFDERFFMYYGDNDLCRRFWSAGKRVVYQPRAEMVHYHRRASADGNFFTQLFSRFVWIQIHSALKYFHKYRGAENPRLNYQNKKTHAAGSESIVSAS